MRTQAFAQLDPLESRLHDHEAAVGSEALFLESQLGKALGRERGLLLCWASRDGLLWLCDV